MKIFKTIMTGAVALVSVAAVGMGQSLTESLEGTEAEEPYLAKSEEEMEQLKVKAEQGDAQAQFEYGVALAEEAWSITRENMDREAYYEGLRYLHKAHDQGHAKARISYLIYAMDLVREALDGSAQAACDLGDLYLEGAIDEEFHPEGIKWLQLAEEMEHTGARMKRVRAVSMLRVGAKHENAKAQCALGECYLSGYGVEPDPAAAVELLNKAAEQGNLRAQSLLGECYVSGLGVEKNTERALELLRPAAEAGDSYAQATYAVCCATGVGMEANPQEAIKWYKLSADAGNAMALKNLAVCYLEGFGVEKDTKKVTYLLEMAAGMGFPSALFHLGVCYFHGYGVKQDQQEAVRFWIRAARLNYAPAVEVVRQLIEDMKKNNAEQGDPE